MQAPFARRKNAIKCTPTLGDIGERERNDEDANTPPPAGDILHIASEFRSALNALFETLEETQPRYVFCTNPNDSQLPHQLEGRSAKGQIRSVGLLEITKRCAHAFPAGVTYQELFTSSFA